VSDSIAWAASSHTGDSHDANDSNGFDVREPGDDIFPSYGRNARLSPVPRGLRPDDVGGACGRLAGGRLPDGTAVRAAAHLPVVGPVPRHVHRRVGARPPAPQRRSLERRVGRGPSPLPAAAPPASQVSAERAGLRATMFVRPRAETFSRVTRKRL